VKKILAKKYLKKNALEKEQSLRLIFQIYGPGLEIRITPLKTNLKK